MGAAARDGCNSVDGGYKARSSAPVWFEARGAVGRCTTDSRDSPQLLHTILKQTEYQSLSSGEGRELKTPAAAVDLLVRGENCSAEDLPRRGSSS